MYACIKNTDRNKHTESIHIESTQTESIQTKSIHTESIQTESINTESIQTKSIQKESIQTESIQKESLQTESIQTGFHFCRAWPRAQGIEQRSRTPAISQIAFICSVTQLERQVSTKKASTCTWL